MDNAPRRSKLPTLPTLPRLPTLPMLQGVVPSTLANLLLLAAVTIGGFIYAAAGSSARDSLITDLLVNLIIVIGFHIFIGNTGVLSFGHVGISAVASYVMALFAIPIARKATLIPNAPFGLATSSMNVIVASVVGVLIAVVLSLLLAVVVARTSGLAATMITLALLFVVKQVAENWKDLTNGAGNLSSIPRLTGNLWPIIGAVIAIVVAVVFKSSRTGRLAIATREDELAAGAMGINVFRPRFWAFVVSGAVVALGGILRVQSLGSLGPQQFSFDFTILILAMLVVGGMQTVTGAIAGTVFITIGKEIARFLGDGPQFLGFTWPKVDGLPDLFLAASLLVVLLLKPTGMLGRFDLGSLFKRFARTRMVMSNDPVSFDAAASGAALTTNGLGVTFGGFTALDNVSIKVASGQIHGLIGPNGAGKTTLINLLTGVVEATRGTVDLGGRNMEGAPYVRARAGIARTFQNLRVFSALSVRENVATADITAARYRADRPTPGVDALLKLVSLTAMAERPASTLDYGSQRRLEIARAAALRPDFLLLDEPTSGMSESESLTMVDDVRRVAQAIGAGVLVVDHDLGFITRICDYITVLDQGSVLAAGTPAEIQKDQRVIDAYLGTSAS
jgi:branched-chain amino acid transport system permease protein